MIDKLLKIIDDNIQSIQDIEINSGWEILNYNELPEFYFISLRSPSKKTEVLYRKAK